MTQHYLERWLSRLPTTVCSFGDAADNPDQRIADDIKKFIDGENGARILPIGIGLLSSVVTLGSFVVILWGLSEAAPISLFGLPIPGYLVWAALIYALVGTLLTHLIGRKLIGLNFMQQLRSGFSLQSCTRAGKFRTDRTVGRRKGRNRSAARPFWAGGDQLARHHDTDEAADLLHRRLSPSIDCVSLYRGQPGLFFRRATRRPDADGIGLQRAGGAVLFHHNLRADSRMGIGVDRLDGFDKAATAAQAAAVTPVIELRSEPGKRSLDIDNLLYGSPTISRWSMPMGSASMRGVLLTGPSGAGKSTLFRAIAGIWPFGSGTISVPAEAEVMLLPQRPYFPVASVEFGNRLSGRARHLRQ